MFDRTYLKCEKKEGPVSSVFDINSQSQAGPQGSLHGAGRCWKYSLEKPGFTVSEIIKLEFPSSMVIAQRVYRCIYYVMIPELDQQRPAKTLQWTKVTWHYDIISYHIISIHIISYHINYINVKRKHPRCLSRWWPAGDAMAWWRDGPDLQLLREWRFTRTRDGKFGGDSPMKSEMVISLYTGFYEEKLGEKPEIQWMPMGLQPHPMKLSINLLVRFT